MRILHFYKTSFPESMGGVEQVIDQIARGTNNHGIHTDVLSLSEKPSHAMIEVNGYQVHHCKLNFQIASNGFSFSVFKKFKELALQADLIHYHFPWPFMDLVHLFTRTKKPTLVTYHSDIVRQKYWLKLYQPLMNWFLKDVGCIVATSPNYLATSNVLAKYKEKIQLITYGLDKKNYPVPTTEKLNYWGERFGPKFFLFVGVLRYYKGLHILLEAAKGTSYPIVIVGAGPIEAELKKQAEETGLSNIHFLGFLSDEDKVALLTLCYAVLFPSHLRSEAFGISLLEGAMYGKPLISSEIGTGTSFINIANDTGLVVPPSDPLALRQAMRTLWDNPEMAAEMGLKAEARYRELFTADKMVASYIDLYRKLIEKAK
jgi:O-antigen biosynthesis rhamnosyltransferase